MQKAHPTNHADKEKPNKKKDRKNGIQMMLNEAQPFLLASHRHIYQPGVGTAVRLALTLLFLVVLVDVELDDFLVVEVDDTFLMVEGLTLSSVTGDAAAEVDFEAAPETWVAWYLSNSSSIRATCAYASSEEKNGNVMDSMALISVVPL